MPEVHEDVGIDLMAWIASSRQMPFWRDAIVYVDM